MKYCSECGQHLPLSEFNKKCKKVDGTYRLQHMCRECQKKFSKSHYNANKSMYMKKAKKNDKIVRLANIRLVLEYYKTHPCIECGETNPLVLEFDHRDHKTKTANVSDLVHQGGYSWTRIKEEIDKCDVLCSNHHSIKTAKERNSIMYRILSGSEISHLSSQGETDCNSLRAVP